MKVMQLEWLSVFRFHGNKEWATQIWVCSKVLYVFSNCVGCAMDVFFVMREQARTFYCKKNQVGLRCNRASFVLPLLREKATFVLNDLVLTVGLIVAKKPIH